MNRQSRIKSYASNNKYRFCRFIRRTYAAFASLKCEVTIGVLKGLVANSLLRKSCESQLNYTYREALLYNYYSTEIPDEEILNSVNSTSIPTIILSLNDAAAKAAHIVIQHTKKLSEKYYTFLTAFFVP